LATNGVRSRVTDRVTNGVTNGRARPKADTTQAGHGGRSLRREHRRIEQTLVLLASDPGVEETVLRRVLADVSAHLETKETLVYPVVEGTDPRPLRRQREIHGRIRILVSKIARGKVAIRWAYLQNLSITFREHASLVDREVLPALESALSPAALSELELRMRQAHAVALESAASRLRPRPAISAPSSR
jgi:hypothetical protein